MATYRIQGPDGKSYAFDAPPGLSPQQVDIIRDGLFQTEEPAPAPVVPEQKGATGIIPSVIRGGRGIYSLLGDVAPAMAAKFVGADEYAKRQMQEAAEYQKETQRLYPSEVPSFTDIKDVGSALTYIKESIAEAIPSLIPSLVTGGAAAIVSRGAQAAASRVAAQQVTEAAAKGALTAEAVEATKQAALKAAEEAAKRTALKYQAAGAIAGSAAQNVPEVYQNIYEKGEGELPDLAPALVAGGFNSVLDAIMPIQLLRKTKLAGIPEEQVIGAWYKRAGIGATKGFFTEGGTEAIQEMSSAAAESFVVQNAKFFTPENFVRFLDAGLKGGFGGAAISGASDVVFGRAQAPEETAAPPGEEADALAKTLGEGEADVAELEPAAGRKGTRISELPIEPSAPAGTAGTQQPGVVSTEQDAQQPPGGAPTTPPPVTEPPAPPAPTPPAPTPPAEAPALDTEGYKPYSEWMKEREKDRPPAPAPAPAVPYTAKEIEERKKRLKQEIKQDESKIGIEYDKERTSLRFDDANLEALYNATSKGEFPETIQPGTKRFSDTLTGAGIEDPGLYRLPDDFENMSEQQQKEYVQGLAGDVHEELNSLLGKRAELPLWKALTRDAKDVFLAGMTENTPEDRARARRDLRTYLNRIADVQGRTRTKVVATPEAGIYERNRAAYDKFEGISFPSWDRLGDELRKLFTTTLRKFSPEQKAERGTLVQHDMAFKEIGDKLKEQKRISEERTTEKKRTAPASYIAAQEEIQREQERKEKEKRLRSESTGSRGKELRPAFLPNEIIKAIAQGDLNAAIEYLRTKATGGGRVISQQVARLVAERISKLGLKTKIKIVDYLPNNHLGEYDPKTDTISLNITDGLTETTLLHELAHAATVKIINKYLTEGEKSLEKTQLDAIKHLKKLMDLAKKSLRKDYPGAFTNLYEFVGYSLGDAKFQAELSRLDADPLDYTMINTPDTSLWSEFLASMMQLFKAVFATRKTVYGQEGVFKTNVMLESLAAIEQIMVAPDKEGVDLAPLPQAAIPAGTAPSEMTQEEFIKKVMGEVTPKAEGTKSVAKFFMSKAGYNWLVTKFQNDRQAIKNATQRAEKFGILERLGDKINDVYGQITRSTGMAVDLYATEMDSKVQDVHDGVERYAKARKIPIQKALSELHLILEARHEPERRLVKFLMKVPLDDIKQYKIQGFEGAKSAAGWREFFLEELATKDLTKAQVKEMRGLLEDFALDAEGKYYTRTLKSVDSKGRTKETIIDDEAAKAIFSPNGEMYSVIAGRSAEDIARIKNAFDKKEYKEEIDAVANAIKVVHEETIRLNKEANYWSKPVDNVKEFYGYENYVPFKGRPGKVFDEELGLESRRLGGELQDVQTAFEGRISESENPLLQSLAEGAQAAMRAGRKDLTLAIKNAIKDGIIKGDKQPVDTIKFSDRYLRGADKEKIGGPDKIFHYLPDGTIEVWRITNKEQLESIRRSYRTAQPLIDIANSITSTIGQGHTRYNPAFAPMNFVRDSMTNAFLLGAELGPKKAAQLIQGIAAEVATGGLNKSMKFALLYANKKFDEIKQLAGGDAAYDTLNEQQRYYRDLSDYVRLGGKVSYLQGVAAKGALEGLMKEIGRSGIMKKKDQVDKFFDIYNDMFELAARVGAYRMLKEDFKRDAKTDKDRNEAQVRAVEVTKNLANFEQVGQWGKAAGAAFMFFRPAATGAVRAIDALKPMFGFDEASFREEAESEGRTKEQIDTAVKKMREESQHARRMAGALAGAGVVIYLAAMMLADDDEAGRNRVATDDMARWTRYARFFIPGFERPLQMPWAFGPGAFAAAGAQVASLASGRVRFGDMMSNIASIGLDSFLPLPFSRISPIDNFPAFALDSITPSAFRPFFEYVMNLDGLGREIYNNRQSRYGDAYTGGDNIPEIYKAAARSLFNATQGKVDWSPNTMYFFTSNYIDGFAKMLSSGYNVGLTVAGQKDFDLKNDALLVSSFVGSKSNVDAREFSRAEKYIKGLEKRYNSLKDKPEMLAEYAREHPEEIALVSMYNQQINGGLRTLRQAANQIRADQTLSPGERKARVEQMVQLQNAIKRNTLAGFEAVAGYSL